MKLVEAFFLKQNRAVIFAAVFLIALASGVSSKSVISETENIRTETSMANPVSSILCLFVCIWLWTLLSFFQERLPQGSYYNKVFAKYLLVAAFVIYTPMSFFAYYNMHLFIMNPVFSFVFFLVLFFVEVMLLYSTWYVSRMLKTYFEMTVRQGPISILSDILLFPVTLWKLQPAIQNIYEHSTGSIDS